MLNSWYQGAGKLKTHITYAKLDERTPTAENYVSNTPKPELATKLLDSFKTVNAHADDFVDRVNQDYTYHVDRSKFDLLLLKHAESLGSSVYQGVGVNEVLFDDNDFANGVRFSVAGKDYELPAKFVVDASGRNSVLGTQRHLVEVAAKGRLATVEIAVGAEVPAAAVHMPQPDADLRRQVLKWATALTPLGDETVKRRLNGAKSRDRGRFPTNVLSWHNVSAEDDWLCHDNTVGDDFRAMLKQRQVSCIRDYRVYNLAVRYGRSNPHSSVGYLVHPRVSKLTTDWLRQGDEAPKLTNIP